MTEVAIQYCEKYVLQPYGWLLCFVSLPLARRSDTQLHLPARISDRKLKMLVSGIQFVGYSGQNIRFKGNGMLGIKLFGNG